MQVVLDTVTVVLALDINPKAASGDGADATDGSAQGHQGTCQLRIPTASAYLICCRTASLSVAAGHSWWWTWHGFTCVCIVRERARSCIV